MGQDKKTPITINEVDYFFEDLTKEQQTLFNHCVDLDRKLSSAQFNLDQLLATQRYQVRLCNVVQFLLR